MIEQLSNIYFQYIHHAQRNRSGKYLGKARQISSRSHLHNVHSMAERDYRQPLPPPRCLSKLLFNRYKLNICVGLLSSIPDFLHYISTQTCTTIKHIVEHHLNATHSFLIARLTDHGKMHKGKTPFRRRAPILDLAKYKIHTATRKQSVQSPQNPSTSAVSELPLPNGQLLVERFNDGTRKISITGHYLYEPEVAMSDAIGLTTFTREFWKKTKGNLSQ